MAPPPSTTTESGRWNWDRFFRRLSRFEEAGLVEWTLYLVEGGEEDHAAGLIAPIGVLEGAARHSIRRDGPEWDLRRYGARAALCLLAGTEEDDALEVMTQSWEESARSTLVALDRDYAEANLVAIARMRYRPRTAPTASWWGDVTSTCSDLMAVYREITRQRRPGLLAFEAADIKGISKEHQGWDQSDINGTYDRVASVAHPSGALALSL